MALLGSKLPSSPAIDDRSAEKKRGRSDFWLLLVITFIFGGSAYRYTFAIPGLLLPLFFFKRVDAGFILCLCSILVFKILSSLLMEAGKDYKHYAMDYFWMAREVASVFLFFAWMLMGQRIIDAHIILNLGWKAPALMILILYGFVISYFHRLYMGTIDNLAAMLLLMYYILIIGAYSQAVKIGTLSGLILTGLMPMESSFAVIACVILILIFILDLLGLAQKIFPWRKVAAAGILLLLVMSLFAYEVYVRPTRENGEGNNGYSRATLAEAGYHQLLQEPILGSQMGRGILPMPVIEKLGWSQYFFDTMDNNIYALSFHNSFIYLLTRFGLLSLALFGLFSSRIPRNGPLHTVMFTLILLLGAGANVVIESLRSGPGVGFALGALIPLSASKER